jgi:predicted transcriptional regulator
MPEDRLSMRLDPGMRYLLDELARQLHIPRTNVIKLGLLELAAKRRIKVPPELAPEGRADG